MDKLNKPKIADFISIKPRRMRRQLSDGAKATSADYYRFRPWSELTLKEIFYSEVFFTSTDECNDPSDGIAFHEFPSDAGMWRRIIDKQSSCGPYIADENHVKHILHEILALCPISANELTNNIHRHLYPSIRNQPDGPLFTQLIEHIRSYLMLYAPQPSYFASFTTSPHEPLMWSHYASQHEGVCLIFRAENDELPQHPLLRKVHIPIDVRTGIAERMNYGVDETFLFSKINYGTSYQKLNAFHCFPEEINSKCFDKESTSKYMQDVINQELSKHASWEYENEHRLILPAPPSWMFGQPVQLSKQNRIFNYHPDWLVGIILGARLSSINKKRITELLGDRETMNFSWSRMNRRRSSFAIFESSINMGTKGVRIRPISILSNGNITNQDQADFSKAINEWNNGYVIKIQGGSSGRFALHPNQGI